MTEWISGSDAGSDGLLVMLADPNIVWIRDQKTDASIPWESEEDPIIRLTWAEWLVFIGWVRQGQQVRFVGQTMSAEHTSNGGATIKRHGVVLGFTPNEWFAFTEGVDRGIFEFSAMRRAATEVL